MRSPSSWSFLQRSRQDSNSDNFRESMRIWKNSHLKQFQRIWALGESKLHNTSMIARLSTPRVFYVEIRPGASMGRILTYLLTAHHEESGKGWTTWCMVFLGVIHIVLVNSVRRFPSGCAFVAISWVHAYTVIDIVWCIFHISWNVSLLCEQHSVIDITKYEIDSE